MIRLLMFDFDGTLIDSAKDYQIALNRLMAEEGKLELSLSQVIDGLGYGLRKLMHKVFPELNLNDDYFLNLQDRFQEYYEANCHQHTQFYPGALEFLESWDGKLALITNKNYAPTIKIMKHLGLMHFNWIAIYGFDSLPERKPHPRPLNEALKLANIQAHEALMIGDSPPDILAAHAAGVSVAAVDFGYTEMTILEALKPSAFLKSYSELPSLISSFQ